MITRKLLTSTAGKCVCPIRFIVPAIDTFALTSPRFSGGKVSGRLFQQNNAFRKLIAAAM